MTKRQQLLIFLHPSDELYGADRMLLEMLAAVPAEIRVEVWLPSDLDHPEAALCHELERRGVCVRHEALPIMRRAYRTPSGVLGLVGRSVKLIGLLRAARPQTVYCTTSAAFLGAPLARIARVPRVIGHLQEIWSKTDQFILGATARSCHTLLAISSAVRSSMPAVTAHRTTVVPNGTPKPEGPQRIGQQTSELRFLVASRWNGWKGHRTLLAAWDLAGAPGHLVVLGGPPPSGEFVDVPLLVAHLQCPESVSVIGEVADVSSYILEADVVLVPSDQPEPFGLVAIEAFARGRPVIGSAAGGLLDVVTDGSDGWLYPPTDVSALAAVLTSLTRTAVAAAGRRAFDSYQRKFTVERFAMKWRETVLEVQK